MPNNEEGQGAMLTAALLGKKVGDEDHQGNTRGAPPRGGADSG